MTNRPIPNLISTPKLADRHLSEVPSMTRITAHDLMDSVEVAAAFGVTTSSLAVAMSSPEVFPTLAARLPAPLRKIGRSWVWLRADIEAALEVKS